MSAIEIYGPQGGVGGVSRRTGRALQQIGGHTSVQIVRVESRADIQVAQVDALSAVAQRGLQGVAFLSQVEQQLAQAVPLATSRLQAIGDIAALSLSEIVMDTANKLRRI